jgi:hypothetical protein
MDSLKELYRIGVGPSSSHTMAPRRAAEIFLRRHPSADHYRVILFACLAATGKHYAALIKEAMNDFYGEKAEAPEKPAKNVSANKDEKAEKTDRYLTRELAKNSKYIKAAKEKLKPIQTKKHLKLFIDLKKHANKLKNRILALSQRQPDLSEKQKKRIIKKATALNTMLKNVGGKKKGKSMKALAKEIQSFSKFIK